MSDEEVAERARQWVETDKARPRQEFVAAILVIVGLTIVVSLFLVFR